MAWVLTKKKNKDTKIYQFHVSLKNYKPNMWRRILVESETKVSDLAYIVLSLFKADGSHLFEIEKMYGRKDYFSEREIYTIKNKVYYDFNDDDEQRDAKEYTLNQLDLEENSKLQLWYDFGDDWIFTIKLEEISERDENIEYPIAIKGKGYGIIDDCGGPFGLMEIIQNGEIEEIWGVSEEEMKIFDLQEANDELEEDIEFYRSNYESH